MSRQVLFSYNEMRAALPKAGDQFIEDYSALKEDLVSLATSLKPQSGLGSPEGNITANNSMVYFDTTNSPASVNQYFNADIGSNTGWVIVN